MGEQIVGKNARGKNARGKNVRGYPEKNDIGNNAIGKNAIDTHVYTFGRQRWKFNMESEYFSEGGWGEKERESLFGLKWVKRSFNWIEWPHIFYLIGPRHIFLFIFCFYDRLG